jgi:hypothetical protein
MALLLLCHHHHRVATSIPTVPLSTATVQLFNGALLV